MGSLLRNKSTLQTPKCPRAWLWPTSAKHTLRTSKRPKSTDTWCSTSRRRSPSRWSLWDFEYEHQCQGTTDSSKKQKLFLMSWCPDSAKIKKKMSYSSSFDALKKSLVGVHKYIQATDS